MNSSHAKVHEKAPDKARDLPSLNLLRAFEAVGRHHSVTLAAAELHVTQSAVSHQIKALENWLGLPLVRREGRRLVLTEQGAAYYPSLCSALDLMAQATARIKPRTQRHSLSVSVMSTFAAQWLIPRLALFCDAAPNVDVQLSTTRAKADFDPAAFDVAIHCMNGEQLAQLQASSLWQGTTVGRFLPDGMTPVCRAGLRNLALATKAGGTANPASPSGSGPWTVAELQQHTLLHSRSTPMAWADWLSAAGSPLLQAAKSLTFDHGHLAIQAASQGMGIALGAPALCADAVRHGLLVLPFPQTVIYPKNYYWICAPRSAGNPHVAAFCRWLETKALEPL